MNTSMMMDVDPLSPYEAQYDYPLPTNPLPATKYYQHPPVPAPYFNKDDQPQNYQIPYQPPPEPVPETYPTTETTEETQPTEPVEEEDIKPDIAELDAMIKKKTTYKRKGKTSNYWNKKITDKDFAFYGCSVCNIAYTDIQELDQHVVIHTDRLTSYDLRLINLKKRKRLKRAKKKQKKESKIKKECEVEIKPEDGYIGTEKASEFKVESKEGIKQNVENNENNPVNSKTENQNHVNVYKCFGCNKQFALSYYLRIHVRSHTDEKPYTCSACGQRFITASKLGRHTKRIHLAVRHQCRICYKIFSRFELLVKHFDSKHPEDKLEGEPYDYNAILPYLKELEEELKLEKEKKQPKTEDPWEVPPSTETAQTTVVAKAEVTITKQEDKVTLPTNLDFLDENKGSEGLPSNVIIKEVKVDFEIKQEVEDYSDDHGIDHDHGIGDDHGINDTNDHSFQDDDTADDGVKHENPGFDEEYAPSQMWVRPHSPLAKTRKRKKDQSSNCEICNKTFAKKSSLEAHMKVHTGEKPFACTVCGRGYSTAVALRRHSTTHNNKQGKNVVKPKTEKTEPNDEAKDSTVATETDAKVDPGSEEEYFPSETWVRSPSPLPEPAAPPPRSATTCEICNKQLCSKTYLAVHMRTHTGEKPFSCYICGRGFITASKMHRHVLTHDESWEGKNKIKSEDTRLKLETKTEENEDGEEKPEEKEVIQSANRLLLKKTKKSFFEKKGKESRKWTHVCEFCNQKFLHLETLEVHRKCHSENENMKCYYCLEPYEEPEALKAHEASHAGPKPYLCTLCGNHYKKRGPMVYHRKKCKGQPDNSDKKYLCEMCNKGYTTHTKLQRHLASHSVSQFTLRYECPVCAHMFHTRYHVQMHLRSHIKEGLILEENRNAVLAMVLQNARKIPKSTDLSVSANAILPPPDPGADERSRICNICGQIFQHFYYLEEHLKTHGSKLALEDFDQEEEKKHTCQVCSKSFKLPYYLKLHSYTHTKEKPFICQQCGKGFITKGKLKRHLETHQGLKKYQCHICYKFFTRPSYLRIHVRTIHGTQDYNFRDYGIGVPIGLSQD